MSFDTRRDDAVLVRMLVSWSWALDWAEGIVAGRGSNGSNASVYDGLDGRRLGCSGIALYIIIELQQVLARHTCGTDFR
jgi:hypothetical protein